MNRPLSVTHVSEVEVKIGDVLEKAARNPRRRGKTANGRMVCVLNLRVELTRAYLGDIFDVRPARFKRVVGAKADVLDEPVVKLMDGLQEIGGFLFGTYEQGGRSKQLDGIKLSRGPRGWGWPAEPR